jgi:hypothetical protein
MCTAEEACARSPPQWRSWKFTLVDTVCCVDWEVMTDTTKQNTAFISMVNRARRSVHFFLNLLDSEGESSRVVQNNDNHSPKDTAPPPRRPCSRIFMVDCVWNVMAHAQKPHFVFRRNGRVYLNRQGGQFSWILAAELCASAAVMLDTPRFVVFFLLLHAPLLAVILLALMWYLQLQSLGKSKSKVIQLQA